MGSQTVQLMGFVPFRGKLSQKRKETLGCCSHHLVTDPGAVHSLGDAQEKLPLEWLLLCHITASKPAEARSAENSSSPKGSFGPRLNKFKLS